MSAVSRFTKWARTDAAGNALDLVRRSSGVEHRVTTSNLSNPANWLFDALTGGTTGSGISVSGDSALSNADVYACVRVLSDAVASLPLHTYVRVDGGRERDDAYPSQVLLDDPSPFLTPANLWGMVTAHLNLWGNAFIAKLRAGSGGPVQRLWVLHPGHVKVTAADGEPVFTVEPYSGVKGGVFSRLDILHIKGLTVDGYCGVSPIGMAREAVGLGSALEQFAANWFKNSSAPGGVIEMPGMLSDDASKRLRTQWEAFHRGVNNTGRVAVLEGGAKFNPVTMPPEDIQFVEQRKLSATQIARIFRVPPWMIGADAGSSMTYSNVEQQNLSFATYSVRPWLVAIEQALAADEDLYPDRERYPEFLMDALLRADTSTRTSSYSQAIGRWMTRDEIRRAENLPATEGGDEFPADVSPASAGEPAATEARSLSMDRSSELVETRGYIEREVLRIPDIRQDEIEGMAKVAAAIDRLGATWAALPPPVVNVDVNVPDQPAPQVVVNPADVVVNVPQQPAPNVTVEVPREKDKVINLQRDKAGRLKSATVEEEG